MYGGMVCGLRSNGICGQMACAVKWRVRSNGICGQMASAVKWCANGLSTASVRGRHRIDCSGHHLERGCFGLAAGRRLGGPPLQHQLDLPGDRDDALGKARALCREPGRPSGSVACVSAPPNWAADRWGSVADPPRSGLGEDGRGGGGETHKPYEFDASYCPFSTRYKNLSLSPCSSTLRWKLLALG